MDQTALQKSVTRLDIPSPGSAIVGLCLSMVAGFFVAVAVFNLVNFRSMPNYAIVLSILWLVMVVGGLYCGISCEQGLRQFIVNRFSEFSKVHFAEVDHDCEGGIILSFRFVIFGRTVTLFQIPGNRINTISWSTGQGSYIAGRDMDDWHVCVWFSQKGAQRWTVSKKLEDDLHIVGQPGPKSTTRAFGKELMALLQDAGIDFFPTEDECEFTTKKPDATDETKDDGSGHTG